MNDETKILRERIEVLKKRVEDLEDLNKEIGFNIIECIKATNKMRTDLYIIGFTLLLLAIALKVYA